MRYRFYMFFFCLLLYACAACPAQDGIRVAVIARQDGEVDGALTDLMAVSLASISGVKVLERAASGLLFAEWEHAGLTGEDGHRPAFGRVEGVDYFVWISLETESDKALLEIAEAAGGRHSFVTMTSSNPESLVRELVDHISAIKDCRPVSETGIQYGLVLVCPAVIPVTSNNIATAERLMAELAQALIRDKVFLMHRRHTVDLVTEQWWAEKGLVAASPDRRPLAGARFILAGKLSLDKSPPRLGLRLIDTSTGARKAACDMALGECGALPDRVTEWVAELVSELWAATEPDALDSSMDRIHPDALAWFYQGVLLFNERKYIEAFELFSRAYAMEPGFQKSAYWIRECFAAAGFAEVATNLDLYLKAIATTQSNVKVYHNHWKHSSIAPGVNFLGLTCRAPELQFPRDELLERILRRLEQNGPLFLPGHMGMLTREYDALVGLEAVEGVNWRVAPPMIFDYMVSAGLYTESGEFKLDLVSVKGLDPLSCRRVTVRLGPNRREWDEELDRGVATIFDSVTSGGGKEVKKTVVEESAEELKEALSREFKDSTYLKLLLKDPANAFMDHRFPVCSGEWGRYVKMGLTEYFIRVVNDDEKPWHEMLLLTKVNPRGYLADAPWYYKHLTMPRFMAGMRKIAKAYPSHPAGLAARYNVLLWNLHPENYQKSREELADIISKVESMSNKTYYTYSGMSHVKALTAMKSIFAALSMELDEPFDPMPRYDFCDILLAVSPGTFHLTQDTWVLMPIAKTALTTACENNAKQVACIFLYLMPYMLDNPLSRSTALERGVFILANAPDSNIAMGMAAQAILECMTGGMDESEHEKFAELCEDYARNLIKYFSRQNSLQDMSMKLVEPFLGVEDRNYRGLSLRRMHWLPDTTLKRLENISDEIKAFVVKVAEKKDSNSDLIRYLQDLELLARSEALSEDDLLKLVEAELNPDLSRKKWISGYSGRHLLTYMEWKKVRVSKPEWMRICREMYQKMHETQRDWSHMGHKERVFAYFGLKFFHGGEDDLADRIHSEILAWQQEHNLRPHAYCMLVLAAHRRGDVPTAFRLAQQGIEALNGDEGILYEEITNSGYSGRGIKVTVMLRDFIAAARIDPSLPYKSPFRTRNDTSK